MDTPLPANEALVAYSNDLPWREIEQQKLQFTSEIRHLIVDSQADTLPLERL